MSSSSQRPPALACGRSVDQGALDLEEPARREGVREIQDQEVVEEQIAQRMAPVRSDRPRRRAVQAIEEGQVGVETRLVERPVHRGEREGVFAVVEIAQLDALRARSRASGWPG